MVFMLYLGAESDLWGQTGGQGNQDSGGDNTAEETNSDPANDTKPSQINAAYDFVFSLSRIFEAPEGQQEVPYAKRDLTAQESMARSAYFMLWPTWSQVLLSGIGILFIWRTLVATKRATVAAAVAAEAAQKSITVTRELGEKKIRAYILIKSVSIMNIVTDRKPTFSVAYKNCGQTPANYISWKICFYIAEKPKKGENHRVFFPKEFIPTPQFLSSEEDDVVTMEASDPVDNDTVKDVDMGRQSVFFAGVVSYKDTFGVIRRTCFRFVQNHTELSMNGSVNMAIDKKGNRTS